MTKTLFSLQMRIASELVDLPVFQDDCNGSLLDRLCDHQAVKAEFRKIISVKLKESLAHILKSKPNNWELRDKVKNFIEQQNSRTNPPLKKSTDLNKRPELHPKNTLENSQQQNHPGQETRYLIANPPQSGIALEKRLLVIPQFNKPHSSTQKGNVQNQFSSEPSQQIIAAYQTVYTKCRDPELKIMIRKTLNELQKFDNGITSNVCTSGKYHTLQNPEHTSNLVTPEKRRQSQQHTNERLHWRQNKSVQLYGDQSVQAINRDRSPLVKNETVSSFVKVVPLRSKSGSSRRYNYLVSDNDSMYM